MREITPVILCGGAGTRLWPLSRKRYPKQFARLLGDQSLFQRCAVRMQGDTGAVRFGPPVTVTASDFRFLVAEQLMAAGVDPGPILIEPEGRNTAPAILAAAICAQAEDPEAVLLVAPSDHVLPDVAAFHAAVLRGCEALERGHALITFGIRPDHPETGYGYLELAEPAGPEGVAVGLTRFVEKPDAETAQQMVQSGDYLWNSGIFLFTARAILDAFAAHAPEMIDPVTRAVSGAETDLGFLRLAPDAWDQVPANSIDYAIMEKAADLAVVPYFGDWSDLGSWEAVHQIGEADGDGVVTSGPVTSVDCRNSLLRSEDAALALVGLGLDNIIAVAMGDAVLVADRSRSQEVGKALDQLRAGGIRQAEEFTVDHRPWGYAESLVLSERFQVKRIVVNPGAALSLQSHMHRSEHWVVVSGTAKVTVNDTERLIAENESVYIPLGARHRLENPGRVPMVLIEIQTGTYLGEDDITRYEDLYARKEGPNG